MVVWLWKMNWMDVACFKVPSEHLPSGIKENQENMKRDNRKWGRIWKAEPPDYETESWNGLGKELLLSTEQWPSRYWSRVSCYWGESRELSAMMASVLTWDSNRIPEKLGSSVVQSWATRCIIGVSSPGSGWEFFSSPPRPDRLWGPPIFLFNGYQGLFLWG
jgi:hypothetical protein